MEGDALDADVRPSVEHAIATSYSAMDVESASEAPGATSWGSLSASYSIWLPPVVEAGIGARVGFGKDLHAGAVEGFVSLGLAPHFGSMRDAAGRMGSWRPMVAVELGATTAEHENKDSSRITLGLRGDSQMGPFYLGFVARAARFRINHTTASLLGIGVASPSHRFGTLARFQAELVQIGVIF